MMHLIKFLFLLFVMTCLNACEKEFIIITEVEKEEDETIPLINTTVRGNVRDKSTLPLANVGVDLMVNGANFGNTNTNLTGNFILENVPANTDQTLLIIQHPEYAISYKQLNITENLIQFTEVILDENSSVEFNPNENLTFKDSLIEFEIANNSLDLQEINSITLDVNTLNRSDLTNYQHLPYIAIDESNQKIFLDHQIAFQISVSNNNDLLSLITGSEFEVNLKETNYDTESVIWYFDVKESIWKTDESAVLRNISTIALSRIGLISIAVPKDIYSFAGKLLDTDNNILAFAKLTIRDNENNIINEVYTNSLGEYQLDLPIDVAGEINITIANDLIETIPFSNIEDVTLSQILLNNESNACIDVELSTLPFNCESMLTPEMLFDINISSFSNFSLTINNVESSVFFPNEQFNNIDWQSILGNTMPYILNYQDDNNNTKECEAQISLENIGIIAICLDQLTIKFEDEETILLFAQDVNEGSVDTSCNDDLIFQIVRADQCDTECQQTDFSKDITFTRDDIGKTIQYILMVSDSQNTSNTCWGNIIISN